MFPLAQAPADGVDVLGGRRGSRPQPGGYKWRSMAVDRQLPTVRWNSSRHPLSRRRLGAYSTTVGIPASVSVDAPDSTNPS